MKQIQIYKKAYTAQEKLNAIKALKQSSIEYIAHRYHCSVRSLYRWKSKFDGSITSLENKFSRKNMLHPNRHTEQEIKHIKDLIRRNPNIGLNELYGKLRLNFAYKRNPASLYRFLTKNNWYTNTKKKVNYKPQKYHTPEHIGQKWQLDVKYVPTECYVGQFKYERKFYQYTVIDEATRERFIFPYQEQIAQNTVDFIKRAIIYFGYKPDMIQTDNGAEFTYIRQTKHEQIHLFDKYCQDQKIIHKTIKPRTPRHNGKVERSHRNDNERFYKFLRFYSYEDLLLQMKSYLRRSNNIPVSVLYSSDKKQKWLTPMQKRKELLLLDWGIIE